MDEYASSIKLGEIYKDYSLDYLAKSLGSAFTGFNKAIAATIYNDVRPLDIAKSVSNLSNQINFSNFYNQTNSLLTITRPMAQALSTINKINLSNYLVFQNTTNILNEFNAGMKYYNEYLKVDNLYNEETDENLNDFHIDEPKFKYWKRTIFQFKTEHKILLMFIMCLIEHYIFEPTWTYCDNQLIFPILSDFYQWLSLLVFH